MLLNTFLLTALFLAQGAHTPNGATVTGVARDIDDNPLVGVRVAAMTISDAGSTSNLVGSALTDKTGHYLLAVPAGRYFIVAGNPNNPTYYPGVRGREGATVISIASGSATSGLDFVIFAISGVVRNPEGEPLAEARVAAIGVPSARGVTNITDSPMITGKTDDTGHYRLEVPPGRYFVSSGRVGKSIYYPGTADARNAASITVGFGAGSNGLDFLIARENSKSGPEDLPDDLYLLGVERANFGDYSSARLLLLTFIRTYPEREIFPQAKYAMADTFYREGTPESMPYAQSLFEEYVKLFPRTPQAAEARQKLSEMQQKSGRKDP